MGRKTQKLHKEINYDTLKIISEEHDINSQVKDTSNTITCVIRNKMQDNHYFIDTKTYIRYKNGE